MTNKENTVDFSAAVYPGPREWEYRWLVSPDPDFPDTITIAYEELSYYDNRTRSAYEKKNEISFDKEAWEKIKHAVDGVFEKTI